MFDVVVTADSDELTANVDVVIVESLVAVLVVLDVTTNAVEDVVLIAE